MAERVTATVLWYQPAKGYGFLRRDDGGPDAMVHSTVVHDAGRAELRKGEIVEFEPEQRNGRPSVKRLYES